MSRAAPSLGSPDHAPCAHAAHQHERARDGLARAEAACRSGGARLTPIRRRVLETLYGTHRPLGAYDVAEQLAAGQRRVAPITVYRALEFLMEQGLVHRLASRNAYIPCAHDHGSGACGGETPAHGSGDLIAFLICESCGGVDEMSSAALSGAVSQLLDGERFQPHFQILEISGRCGHCRAPEARPAETRLPATPAPTRAPRQA